MGPLLMPADWGEFVQVHDDHDAIQWSPDEFPAIAIQSRWEPRTSLPATSRSFCDFLGAGPENRS